MRYNRRTDRTRAALGGKVRRTTRHALRATARLALHAVNPPGIKIAKQVAKVRGLPNAKGLYFHGGELTKAAAARSARRKQLKEAA